MPNNNEAFFFFLHHPGYLAVIKMYHILKLLHVSGEGETFTDVFTRSVQFYSWNLQQGAEILKLVETFVIIPCLILHVQRRRLSATLLQ